MKKEEIKDIVLDILLELHADIEYEKEKQLVEDKILDSFDLVTIVAELGEEFDIKITAREFVPENFNSVEKITNLVIRLMDEE